jgi:hypothetical protein
MSTHSLIISLINDSFVEFHKVPIENLNMLSINLVIESNNINNEAIP